MDKAGGAAGIEDGASAGRVFPRSLPPLGLTPPAPAALPVVHGHQPRHQLHMVMPPP